MFRFLLIRPKFWIATALLLLSGCGQSAQTADPAQARDALHAVLDAWKGGETPENLATRALPIHVSDVEWAGGYRLIGYSGGVEGRLVGFDMTYPVVLELKTPKGRAVKKTAVYCITTSPQVLVLRQEG